MDTPKLDKIEIDLKNFKIHLYFPHRRDPLTLFFDTPSRRFYFSLIALIINEMKKRDKLEFIGIRRCKKDLKLLDSKLLAEKASKETSQMWGKIRKAWTDENRLPNLEKGSVFKLVGQRRAKPDYEVGSGFEYRGLESECDIWSNLISYDKPGGRAWHYKFAVDTVGLTLDDVKMFFEKTEGQDAWHKFVQNLSKSSPLGEIEIPSQINRIQLLDLSDIKQVDLLKHNKLKVMCWELHWNIYPLLKMTVSKNSDYVEIINSTNIHRYAKVISDELLVGDFQAEIILKGEYIDLQLQAANGDDRNIYVTPAALGVDVRELQKYIITRRGLEVDFRTDYGFILRHRSWDAQNDMMCYLSIALNNWQKVQIHSFKLRAIGK